MQALAKKGLKTTVFVIMQQHEKYKLSRTKIIYNLYLTILIQRLCNVLLPNPVVLPRF